VSEDDIGCLLSPDATLLGTWRGDFVMQGRPIFSMHLDIGADGRPTGFAEGGGESRPMQDNWATGTDTGFRLHITQQTEDVGIVDFIDFVFSGALDTSSSKLAGAYSGNMLDMECVSSQMANAIARGVAGLEEPDDSVTCGQIPQSGEWQMTRQ
jgi:hypothetical protein